MPDIDLPIVQQLLHPPVTLLRRELVTGLFSGSGSLTRAAGPIGVNAFGLSWDFFTVPAGFGFTLGVPVIYEERMLNLAAIHSSLDGHAFVSEYHAFYADGIYWQWENSFPTRVDYDIAPGVSLVFHWLLV